MNRDNKVCRSKKSPTTADVTPPSQAPKVEGGEGGELASPSQSEFLTLFNSIKDKSGLAHFLFGWFCGTYDDKHGAHSDEFRHAITVFAKSYDVKAEGRSL